jgi:hypothetical protein
MLAFATSCSMESEIWPEKKCISMCFKTILFPHEVAFFTTYLNDMRFDLRRGEQGMAFICAVAYSVLPPVYAFGRCTANVLPCASGKPIDKRAVEEAR